MTNAKKNSEDDTFLDQVCGMVKTMRSQTGSLAPGVFVQAAPDVLPEGLGGVVAYQLPTLLSQDGDSLDAIEFARHRSRGLSSPRSALFFETWTVPADPQIRAEVETMRRSGGDPRHHPALVGKVVIVVESDAGQKVRSLEIIRAPSSPDQLRPERGRSGSIMPPGLGGLKGFHLPTGQRDLRKIREWASRMDETHGAPTSDLPELARGMAEFVQNTRTGSLH